MTEATQEEMIEFMSGVVGSLDFELINGAELSDEDQRREDNDH